MDNQEKYMDDPLKQFINHEKIEKAPEGFTSKVMARIQVESVRLKTDNLKRRNLVPLISAATVVVLIITGYLLQDSGNTTSVIPWSELLKNVSNALPRLDFHSLFSFNLPSILIYAIIGILVLSVFDRALNRFFHKSKEKS